MYRHKVFVFSMVHVHHCTCTCISMLGCLSLHLLCQKNFIIKPSVPLGGPTNLCDLFRNPIIFRPPPYRDESDSPILGRIFCKNFGSAQRSFVPIRWCPRFCMFIINFFWWCTRGTCVREKWGSPPTFFIFWWSTRNMQKTDTFSPYFMGYKDRQWTLFREVGPPT